MPIKGNHEIERRSGEKGKRACQCHLAALARCRSCIYHINPNISFFAHHSSCCFTASSLNASTVCAEFSVRRTFNRQLPEPLIYGAAESVNLFCKVFFSLCLIKLNIFAVVFIPYFLVVTLGVWLNRFSFSTNLETCRTLNLGYLEFYIYISQCHLVSQSCRLSSLSFACDRFAHAQ